MTIEKLPTLGDRHATAKRELDKFNMRIFPAKGEYLFGWQSSPSALSRAMPIFVIAIIAFICFAYLNKAFIPYSFTGIIIIIAIVSYIVITKPDRAVIADTYSSPLGDKSVIKFTNSATDFQPEGEIVQSKNSQKNKITKARRLEKI